MCARHLRQSRPWPLPPLDCAEVCWKRTHFGRLLCRPFSVQRMGPRAARNHAPSRWRMRSRASQLHAVALKRGLVQLLSLLCVF